MRSALYYPHTEIRSPELIKSALLLWDQLEYIVPQKNHRPKYKDKWAAAAIELIGKAHCPTDHEKALAEAQIQDFVKRPLPPCFYYTSARVSKNDYLIYPQKFSYKVWGALREAQLAGPPLPPSADSDYPLQEATGLSIMAILADCCAGETFQRVTDRGAAYATLTGLLREGSTKINRLPKASAEQLVPITLTLVNCSKISLERLVKFRQREEKAGGHALRDLRHRYIDRIETCVRTLTTLKGKASDVNEIKRQFREDMSDDLKILRDELRFARNEALLSKEVLFTALALAGTVASWALGVPLPIHGVLTLTGSVPTFGGVIAAKGKYASSRRSILEKHPAAYLYQLTSPLRDL